MFVVHAMCISYMLVDKSLLICIAVKEDAKEALRKKAVACFTEQ